MYDIYGQISHTETISTSAIEQDVYNIEKVRRTAMPKDEDVFTVPELANYLRMKPITIYKHVAGGKLPGFKVGSQWRFKKKTIDMWIETQEKSNLTYQQVKSN